jgi:hypothetical protein
MWLPVIHPIDSDSQSDDGDLPTVFHITHWKAGSQWLHRMFHHWCYERLVLPRPDQSQFLHEPIIPGRIYPTVYVTKQEFDSVAIPQNYLRFLVIRDLRDTLISLVFSMLVSHKPEESKPEDLEEFRKRFSMDDIEAALLHLMPGLLKKCADIQHSWVEAGEPYLTYRDLLSNDVKLLTELFTQQVPLGISRERIEQVILENRFEKLSGGRPRGVEDVGSHERKGIAGDWRNYFTSRVSREFNSLYGELLISTGFEANDDWAH